MRWGLRRETSQAKDKNMETKTFIIQSEMTLTVPLTAIKSLDVQLAGKGSFVGHVIINAGGSGQLRGRLDGKLLEGTDSTDRDLEEVTRLLVPIVFIDNDPVPLVSLTRLATDGGDDAGSPTSPSLAGPGFEIK